ncbi:hypothetical protein BDV96DRAFT_690226 [Lophiotrema nucula]|uniref:CHAT domain-containing protein n=1 Tax=Lophiotrema nucula TaxID=690887 RepID=A0A6A5YYG4_9PLEO|nr:hypothetical protein BDV96DRAFT_690226 [Lophiotrema nucula]
MSQESPFEAHGPPNHIRLRALEVAEKPLAWKVELSLGHSSSKTIWITDPSNAETETLLKWYLQNHVLKDPFDRLRAREAEARLLEYAKSLYSQLTDVLEKRHVQSENTCILEVSSPPELVSIHRLHWEALEHPELMLSLSVCRNITKQGDLQRSSDRGTGTDHINLLYLTARRFETIKTATDADEAQKQDRDINPHVILKPLADALAQLGPDSGVRLEVVRPGSFEALESALFAAKSEGRRFDIIHLDVHGKVENDIGYLKFFKLDDPSQYNAITAERLGKVLQEHAPDVIFMNACNSAAATSTQVEANVASTLLQQGLRAIIGMSYLLMVDAARVFISTFYKHFLENGSGVAIAVSKSRHALAQDQKRRALFEQFVDLQDWIVPVLYTQTPSFGSSWSLTQSTAPQHVSLSAVLSNTFGTSTTIGRDFDLYRVESLLAVHGKVELVGDYGVGLSDFLRYAMDIWQKTNFFDTLLLNTTSSHPKPYIIALPQGRQSPRALFLLDDCVNDITDDAGNVLNTSAEAEDAMGQILEKIKHLFTEISYLKANHFSVLPTKDNYSRIQLLPLEQSDCLKIAYQVSPAMAAYSRDSQDHKLLELLVSRTLRCNPSAVHAAATAFQSMSSYTSFTEFCLQIWGILPADQHVTSLHRWAAETKVGGLVHTILQGPESTGTDVDLLLSFASFTSRITIDTGEWLSSVYRDNEPLVSPREVTDAFREILLNLEAWALIRRSSQTGPAKANHIFGFVMNPILPFALASYERSQGRHRSALEVFSRHHITCYLKEWAEKSGSGVNLAQVRETFLQDPVDCFKVFFVSIDPIEDITALNFYLIFMTALASALAPGLETDSNMLLRILFEKWIEKCDQVLNSLVGLEELPVDPEQQHAPRDSAPPSTSGPKEHEDLLQCAVSISTWLYFDHSLRQSPRSVLITACETVLRLWNRLEKDLSSRTAMFSSDVPSGVANVLLLTVECFADQKPKARSLLETVNSIIHQMPAGSRRKSIKDNYERSTLQLELIYAIAQDDRPGIAHITQELKKVNVGTVTSRLARSASNEAMRGLLTELSVASSPKSSLTKLRDEAPHYAAAALLEAYQSGNASAYLSKASAPAARTRLLHILGQSMGSSTTQFLARKVLQLDAERRKDMHEALGHCEALASLAQERVDLDPWERDQLTADSLSRAGQIAFFEVVEQQKGIDHVKAATALYLRYKQDAWGCEGSRRQLFTLHIMQLIYSDGRSLPDSADDEQTFLLSTQTPHLTVSQLIDLLCLAYETPPTSISNVKNIVYSVAFQREEGIDIPSLLSDYVQESTITPYLCCGAFTMNLFLWFIYDLNIVGYSKDGKAHFQKRSEVDSGIDCLALGIGCDYNELEKFLEQQFEPAYARLVINPEALKERVLTLEDGRKVKEISLILREEIAFFKELEVILFGRNDTDTTFEFKYFEKRWESQRMRKMWLFELSTGS